MTKESAEPKEKVACELEKTQKEAVEAFLAGARKYQNDTIM